MLGPFDHRDPRLAGALLRSPSPRLTLCKLGRETASALGLWGAGAMFVVFSLYPQPLRWDPRLFAPFSEPLSSRCAFWVPSPLFQSLLVSLLKREPLQKQFCFHMELLKSKET